MILTSLEPATISLDELAALVRDESAPVLLMGRSPVLMAAALAQRVRVGGVWLAVGPDYPTVLAARDVATLSWLSDIEHVVIDAPSPLAHVAAMAAMLTNDEITFANDVAQIRHAYNRPAPPRALTLWYVEGDALRSGDERLEARAPRRDPRATLIDFSTPLG